MIDSTPKASWTPQAFANSLTLAINSLQSKIECELDTIRYYSAELGTAGINETKACIEKLRAERNLLYTKRKEVLAYIGL